MAVQLNVPLLGRALLDIVYPRSCAGCDRALQPYERNVCPDCLASLPRTGFGKHPTDNEVYRRFAGLVPVTGAGSYCYFEAGQRLQEIIHALKYLNRPSVGRLLGEVVAQELQQSALAEGVTSLVPVPLHPKKRMQRGYNQSEVFGEGLRKVWGIPLRPELLKRTQHTVSQTGKTRQERFKNMEGVFQASNCAGERVLLLDDVITTGATAIEAAKALVADGAAEVRVLTIAVASSL